MADFIEDIKRILEVAVHAPSGDNSQPWKFRVKSDQITLSAIPGRDNSLFNFKGRGDFVAHGALIENMHIAVSQFGYDMVVRIFPDTQNPHVTAEVVLKKKEPQEEPLFPYISRRATNRKPYNISPLTEDQKTQLRNAVSNHGVELILVDDPIKKQKFADALSVNERLLLENRVIHDYLFSLINWTASEEEKKRTGLFVKTLELLPPQRIVFGFFKIWPLVNLLNKIGLSKFLAKEGSKLYSASGAIGALIIPDDANKNFIATGRAFQRVWLEATRLGLSIQPVAAVIYLHQRIVAHEASALSSDQVEAVKHAYQTMSELCGANNKILSMTFRIGQGGDPSVRSLRREPEINFVS